MVPVLLGLGSNAGFKGAAPLQLLGEACRRMCLMMPDIVVSSVYLTRAMYVTEQDDFYNMAAYGSVSDSCTPDELLRYIHMVEAALGRDRTKEIRNGPRSIDIDIELFGAIKCSSAELTVPHPRISERAFVLIPALEILPKSADCEYREVFAEYARRLPDQGVRFLLSACDFRKRYLQEAVNGTERDSGNCSG